MKIEIQGIEKIEKMLASQIEDVIYLETDSGKEMEFPLFLLN